MSKTATPRPLPAPTPTSQPFWDGARKKKLMLQYDPKARAYQFWPRACSIHTGRRNLEWRKASGKGEIYSFTVTHVPAAGFEDQAPYVVALVELDEGVRMIGNLINIAPEEVEIGMPVRIAWEELSEDITYFRFEPDRNRRAKPATRAKGAR